MTRSSRQSPVTINVDAGEGDLVWRVRAFVYAHLADTAMPPTLAETAERFGLRTDAAQAATVRRPG